MNLITAAVPFFLLAIALEIIWGYQRGHNTYRLNDAFSSLMLGILSQARRFIVLGVGGWAYHTVTELTMAPLWSTDHWLTWVVAFVLYDVCYYWLHRLGHERQILWAAHVAHHQSEDYNLSTALRQTSSGFLLGWVFYIPMYWVGIPAEVIVTVGALNLIYQFWVHTQHVPALGWFEWLFVSPSNHRVHHAQNDAYLDRNYGGVFIIWDRLFGTYQRELPHEPCIYGLRGPIASFNPLLGLTHVYRNMVNDIRLTRRWPDRLRVLVARTGWQPDEARRLAPRDKQDIAEFSLYNPVVSAWIKVNAGLQLLAATVMLAYGVFHPLAPMGYWLWWLLLLWTGVATAAWLDSKPLRYCLFLDIPRLLLLLMVFSYAELIATPWQAAGLFWMALTVCLLFGSYWTRSSLGSTAAVK